MRYDDYGKNDCILEIADFCSNASISKIELVGNMIIQF